MSLVTICCGECGIEFAVPEHFYRECRNKGGDKTWYCPNGHLRAFRESDADKMRRERDRAIQDQARLADELRLSREAQVKAERQVARIKKRAEAALCPCCNRHFSNVERHMKTKHPDVVPLKTVAPVRESKSA